MILQEIESYSCAQLNPVRFVLGPIHRVGRRKTWGAKELNQQNTSNKSVKSTRWKTKIAHRYRIGFEHDEGGISIKEDNYAVQSSGQENRSVLNSLWFSKF